MENKKPFDKNKTYEILFIGNSYTYYNSTVPEEFRRIALSRGYTVNVDSVTKGSYSLELFADPNDEMGKQVDRKICENKYDYVFIQEQSCNPVTDPERFYRGVSSMAEKIRSCGAEPVLYCTWGRHKGSKDIEKLGLESNEAMTWRLAAAYTRIGQELDIIVAYAGLSFFGLYTGTELELYNADRTHPSELGTYVAALTLFSTLFNVPAYEVVYVFGLDSGAWRSVWQAVDRAVSGEMRIPRKYLAEYGLN